MTQNIICDNTPYIVHTVGATTNGNGPTWTCTWCGAKILLATVTR